MTECLQSQRNKGKMDFLCTTWFHVHSELLFTPQLTDWTDGFLPLLTLAFCLKCSWVLFEKFFTPLRSSGISTVTVSMFETHHLDKAFYLDNMSWESTEVWNKVTLWWVMLWEEKKVCFLTHMGLVWSFQSCLEIRKHHVFSLSQLIHVQI